MEAEPERMKALREKYLARFKENPFAPILKKYGTSGAFKALMELGRTPIKNFGGSFPDDFPNPDNLDGPAVLATQIKKYGCWRCNQVCGGIVRGSSVDPEGTSKKPEYESLGALGSYCQIDDLDTVTQLTDMCNRAGLDSISAGAVISFAMECFENGLIRAEQVDGLSLHWGNGQAARALLQMMIDRRGLGELLGEGVMRAAGEIDGSEQFAMHAGGQELAVHDPRQDKDFGLSYQISPTPGRHTQGGVDFVSLSEDQRKIYGLDTKLEQVDPVRFHAEAYAKGTAISNVVNAAGLCMYGFDPMGPEAVVEFLSAVTGWDMDMAECLTAGERIEMMRYLFCLREGYDFVNARVAPRALGNPPLAAGPTAGVSVDMSAVRTAYLEYMGMDPLTGIPGIDRLKSLGLDAFFPLKQAEFLEGKS